MMNTVNVDTLIASSHGAIAKLHAYQNGNDDLSLHAYENLLCESEDLCDRLDLEIENYED